MRVAVFLIVVQIVTCLGLRPALGPVTTNVNLRSASLAGLLGLVGLCAPTDVSAALAPSSWDKEILVETLVAPKNDAKVPKVGDMVAVRFKASFNGNTFDDTFKSDQPYFYRTGVGLILKGLDDTIVHMKEGERLSVQFGGDLSFPNGKPSSPGKPRIPPGARLDYEVLLESLPGQGDPDALILDDL